MVLLWLIKIMVFLFVMFFSSDIKLFLVLVFRVEVGLLIINNCGLLISVLVMVMCCCWLIFNVLVFVCSMWEGSCSLFSKWWSFVFDVVLLMFVFVKYIVVLMFCVIER